MKQIRIATRCSPLAIAQANEVKERILQFYPTLSDQIIILPMKTTGDQLIDQNLALLGGKGLFTKELEHALLEGQADIAVHSCKDLPAHLPTGLIIAAILPREDPRDVYLSIKYPNLSSLPYEAVVGTSSSRRKAQLLQIRPDLVIIPFRGNVQTRLQKLTNNQADATLLAVAGLNRLDISTEQYQILDIQTMLPAVAQAAIGVECCADNPEVINLLRTINDISSEYCINTERGFLTAFNGNCTTPIAAYATISQGQIFLKCLIAKTDGSQFFYREASADQKNGYQLGLDLGNDLKTSIGAGFFI